MLVRAFVFIGFGLVATAQNKCPGSSVTLYSLQNWHSQTRVQIRVRGARRRSHKDCSGGLVGILTRLRMACERGVHSLVLGEVLQTGCASQWLVAMASAPRTSALSCAQTLSRHLQRRAAELAWGVCVCHAYRWRTDVDVSWLADKASRTCAKTIVEPGRVPKYLGLALSPARYHLQWCLA